MSEQEILKLRDFRKGDVVTIFPRGHGLVPFETIVRDWKDFPGRTQVNPNRFVEEVDAEQRVRRLVDPSAPPVTVTQKVTVLSANTPARKVIR